MLHITLKDMFPVKLLPMVHSKTHIPMTQVDLDMTHAEHFLKLRVSNRQPQIRTRTRLLLSLLKLYT